MKDNKTMEMIQKLISCNSYEVPVLKELKWREYALLSTRPNTNLSPFQNSRGLDLILLLLLTPFSNVVPASALSAYTVSVKRKCWCYTFSAHRWTYKYLQYFSSWGVHFWCVFHLPLFSFYVAWLWVPENIDGVTKMLAHKNRLYIYIYVRIHILKKDVFTFYYDYT